MGRRFHSYRTRYTYNHVDNLVHLYAGNLDGEVCTVRTYVAAVLTDVVAGKTTLVRIESLLRLYKIALLSVIFSSVV